MVTPAKKADINKKQPPKEVVNTKDMFVAPLVQINSPTPDKVVQHNESVYLDFTITLPTSEDGNEKVKVRVYSGYFEEKLILSKDVSLSEFIIVNVSDSRDQDSIFVDSVFKIKEAIENKRVGDNLVTVKVDYKNLSIKKVVRFFVDLNIDTGNIQIEDSRKDAEDKFIPPQLECLLYKGGKNKVLFRINKFYPIPTKMPDFSFFKNDPKLIHQEIQDSFLSNLSAEIYRTTTKPNSVQEMAVPDNLYKKLDIGNNEYSFDDYLNINTEFYFVVKIKHEPKAGIQSFGERMSPVYKINVLKDGEFYYLEKDVEDFKIKKTLSAPFLSKVFIEPRQENLESNKKLYESFNSETDFPYFKIRVTSKKTNRRFDLNLYYSKGVLLQVADMSGLLDNYIKIEKAGIGIIVPPDEMIPKKPNPAEGLLEKQIEVQGK